MTDAFRAFQDDAASMTAGELTVENGTDAISIYGQAEIRRDRLGLETARELARIFADAVQVLESAGDLPDKAVENEPARGEIKNPFE